MREEGKLYNDADLSGIKIALVISNQDPKGQERVLVQVLGIHNTNNTSLDNAIWANRCAAERDGSGGLPEPGDYLYVQFLNPHDPMHLIWMGFVRSSFQNENTEPEPMPNTTPLDGLGNTLSVGT